jgi:arylsulfatase
VTIAEVLKAHGFATFAVSASPVVRNTPSNRNHYGEFGRGFDIFDEECLWHNAACVNLRVSRLLDGVREPFFMYLHYMDPHDPYQPPRRFKRPFSSRHDGPEFILDGQPNPLEAMVYAKGEPVEVSAADLQHLVDLYDDEIAYFDRNFGALLDELADRSLMDSTMVVFASDHGEEFLQEHGHVKHCYALFDASTRIPLVMRIPGVSRDGGIAVRVENIDIVPTMLDYLGIDGDGFGFEGSSLRAAIENDRDVKDFRFALQGVQRSVDDGRFKLITRLTTRKSYLYDLHADPQEQHDLYDPTHAVVQPLLQALAEWRAVVERGMTNEESIRVSEEAQERLRALGYLQ